MAAKLYLYSNLAGVVGWAASAGEFRKAHKLTGGYAVRVANSSVECPAGYVRTGCGLANEPVVRRGVTLGKSTSKNVNFYSLGCAILASEMTGFEHGQ